MPKLGVQLYSLRQELSTNLAGIMRELAAIGYDGVEPFGSLDHQAVAALCQELGLDVMSAHLGLPIDPAIAACYGIQQVVVPSMPREQFTSMEGIRQVADALNTAAVAASEHGLRLGYHNHDFEFGVVEGRLGYNIMLDHLSPDIFLEVDIYWAQVAGTNPIDLLGQLGDRASLLHIKDGPAVRDEPMVALGQGVINIPAIIAASQAEWLIVEIDTCATDMLTAIRQSYDYLRTVL